ncbi:MAG: helix-turn-helix domain-containing protein [Deltaproteobacteria bacterium]|nr:helix-turn-helix domain-containing protein [Deltaproteobacteria bacterium]
MISDALKCDPATVRNVKRRYISGGLENAIYDSPRPGAPIKFDGKVRAKITALACSQAPEGHAKWSLTLLADRAVELDIVKNISHTQVGTILKKTK